MFYCWVVFRSEKSGSERERIVAMRRIMSKAASRDKNGVECLAAFCIVGQ